MNSRRSFIRQAGVLAGTSILATALQQNAFAHSVEKWRPVIVSVWPRSALMVWAGQILLSSLKQPGVEVVDVVRYRSECFE